MTGRLEWTMDDCGIMRCCFSGIVMLANPIAVEKVGDSPMKQSVKIEVTGVEIKQGIHYQLEGYETGAFVGRDGSIRTFSSPSNIVLRSSPLASLSRSNTERQPICS